MGQEGTSVEIWKGSFSRFLSYFIIFWKYYLIFPLPDIEMYLQDITDGTWQLYIAICQDKQTLHE